MPASIVFVSLFIFSVPQLCTAASIQLPLLNEIPITHNVSANETRCYLFEMDPDTTRAVVYWSEAKLYLRLEPCRGMPHLRVSVYGCPSDGNIVNWSVSFSLTLAARIYIPAVIGFTASLCRGLTPSSSVRGLPQLCREYMSTRIQNDMIGKGQTVPQKWCALAPLRSRFCSCSDAADSA